MENRAIKLRAWDTEQEIMVYFNIRDLHGSDMGELKADQFLEIEDLTPLIKSGILMQYTGLKDKNGKEIYEGDIVKYFNDYYDLKGLNGCVKSQVEWDNGGFCVDDADIGAYCEDNSDITGLEVIGNLYENPELIKEEIR